MTRAINGAAAKAYFEDLLNRGDISVVNAIMSPDIRFHYPLGDLFGSEAVMQYIEAVRGAFPDVHFTVADLIADNERVAARWSLNGTQTGPFKGKAPSGATVSVPGITVFHLMDGNIKEMWVSFDPKRLVGPKEM